MRRITRVELHNRASYSTHNRASYTHNQAKGEKKRRRRKNCREETEHTCFQTRLQNRVSLAFVEFQLCRDSASFQRIIVFETLLWLFEDISKNKNVKKLIFSLRNPASNKEKTYRNTIVNTSNQQKHWSFDVVDVRHWRTFKHFLQLSLASASFNLTPIRNISGSKHSCFCLFVFFYVITKNNKTKIR